jgi:hypothetical protein
VKNAGFFNLSDETSFCSAAESASSVFTRRQLSYLCFNEGEIRIKHASGCCARNALHTPFRQPSSSNGLHFANRAILYPAIYNADSLETRWSIDPLGWIHGISLALMVQITTFRE